MDAVVGHHRGDLFRELLHHLVACRDHRSRALSLSSRRVVRNLVLVLAWYPARRASEYSPSLLLGSVDPECWGSSAGLRGDPPDVSVHPTLTSYGGWAVS